MRDLGFRALRVVPWLWNLPPSDRRYYPLYAECVQLGIPFCLQVGHTGPLCPSEPGLPIPYLDTVALEFPELVIVGGHIGYPWTAEMISLATRDRANRGTAGRVDRALEALGVDHDVKEYPGAGHSFLNDLSLPSPVRTPAIFVVMGKFNGPSGLHEPSAADARQRIVSFFNRHLKASG